MTIGELTHTFENASRESLRSGGQLKPVVAIGHTKELVDFEAIEAFLGYMGKKGIRVSTFQDVYGRCMSPA
jgi:hypothetical protein